MITWWKATWGVWSARYVCVWSWRVPWMGAEFIQPASDQTALRRYWNIKHRTGLGNPKSTGLAWSNPSVPVTLQSCLPVIFHNNVQAARYPCPWTDKAPMGAGGEQRIRCWLRHLKGNCSSSALPPALTGRGVAMLASCFPFPSLPIIAASGMFPPRIWVTELWLLLSLDIFIDFSTYNIQACMHKWPSCFNVVLSLPVPHQVALNKWPNKCI